MGFKDNLGTNLRQIIGKSKLFSNFAADFVTRLG